MKPRFYLFILFLLLRMSVFSQKVSIETVKTDTINLQQVTLKDGSVMFGYIIETNEKEIVLKTKMAGTVIIDWSKIKSITDEITEIKSSGKIWMKNSNCTRYFVGPSAIPLKKREGYYQNTYVFLNSVNVGITNHLSIGGGFEFLSLFNRYSPALNFFLTPKIGYRLGKENLYIGAGALHLNMRQWGPNEERERQNFNIFYGSFTVGTPEYNFTLSGGWMLRNYTRYEHHETQQPVYDSFGNIMYYNYTYHWTSERAHEVNPRPIMTFSGMARVGKKLALVTENWFIPDSYSGNDYIGMFSYGLRILGDKTSIDLGFINNKEIASAIFIGVPYVDFVIKF